MLYPELLQMGAIQILISIVATVMAIFVAMPFHEFAHAFAAKREGDYTAVAMHRYTLAPHAHFDVKGFIFLFLFRFGWAKPVPIDSRNFKRGRLSLFLVSIAGVLANLILGIFFLFVYMLLYRFFPNFLEYTLYGQLLSSFLLISVSFNFTLVFFNILPIYPLDGYNLIASMSKTENSFLVFMKKYSFIIYLLFIITGLYYLYFNYTAGLLIDGLIYVFSLILGI